jgi:pyruvate kinase
VRAISARLGCALAILQDLQGPKIRTGKLQDGKPVTLIDGSQVTITTRGVVGNTQIISTTYQPLPQDVKSGDRILLDDGLLELRAPGNSARLISNDRPRVPILAYTPSEHVYHQLALWWGVWPHRIGMQGTTEDLIALVEQRLPEDGLAQPGEYVVIMGGLPIASQARTNFVKLHRIDLY